MAYELYAHRRAFEAIPSRGVQRRRIFDFFDYLKDHPNAPGDSTDKDGTLRVRQIKHIGRYSITYWFDAPVGIIMIVDIRPTD